MLNTMLLCCIIYSKMKYCEQRREVGPFVATNIPVIKINGKVYVYICRLVGTTISFTRAIKRRSFRLILISSMVAKLNKRKRGRREGKEEPRPDVGCIVHSLQIISATCVSLIRRISLPMTYVCVHACVHSTRRTRLSIHIL